MRAANKLDRTIIVRTRIGMPRSFLAEGTNFKWRDEKPASTIYVTVDKNFILYNDMDGKTHDEVTVAQVRVELNEIVKRYHR